MLMVTNAYGRKKRMALDLGFMSWQRGTIFGDVTAHCHLRIATIMSSFALDTPATCIWTLNSAEQPTQLPMVAR